MVELAAALPQVVTIEVTTGASPVSIPLQDPALWRVNVLVTSGGTGGEEVLNLPPFTPDADFANITGIGCLYVVGFKTQTDPGDVIKITNDGSDEWDTFENSGVGNATPYQTTSFVKMSYVGASASLVWCEDRFLFQYGLADIDVDVLWEPKNVALQGVDGTATEGPLQTIVQTGAAASGSNMDGGDLYFVIGAGDGSGRQGLWFPQLPTADPMVAGAAWNNAGTIKISAG